MEPELTDADKAAIDVAQLKTDYEDGPESIEELLDKYPISRRTLYNFVRRKGWRRRAPRSVDRNDVVERLLRLTEEEILKLETAMDEGNETDETAALGKLSATLDRLIAVKQATSRKRPSRKSSKLMDEIRHKVAQRLASLGGH